MTRRIACLLCWSLVASPVGAQAPDGPVHLTIHPAAAPSPALKYQLLPDPLDQTPGNAAMLYYRAFSPEWSGWQRKPGMSEKIVELLKAPLQELPRKDLDWILTAASLREVDRAARREFCSWGFLERLREEGFEMLLPEGQALRSAATALALRARLQLADGKYDKAAYSLQTGFGLARNVADAPFLIMALLGINAARAQVGQVEQWVQLRDSPNLYWALTGLPRPCIDVVKPMQGEKNLLFAEFPLFRNLENMQLSDEQQKAVIDRLVRLNRQAGDDKSPALARIELMGMALKFYPEAKQALIQSGHKPEAVEAMPVIQVYAVHVLRQFRQLQEDMFKWHLLPYAQAIPTFQQTQQRLLEARQRLEGMPFADLLPAVENVQMASARLDRRIAALRCVEAIRMYAASHGGALPATLQEIQEVPVPADPMTGKSFDYKAEGNKATLHAAAPAGVTSERNVLTYELTLQP